MVLALCGSAEHQELRVGQLNGHGSYPSSLGARPIRPPHQDKPRIDAIDGAKGVCRLFLTSHTRSLSNGMPVLSARRPLILKAR